MAARWESLRPVRPISVQPEAATPFARSTMPRRRREALVLDPHVLQRRVEDEVHVVVLHVVGPQRRVVGVEHDRRVQAARRGRGARPVQDRCDLPVQPAHLGDVGRGGLVGDAGRVGAVVGADRRLHRVDVGDPLAALGAAAGPVRRHGEAGAGRQPRLAEAGQVRRRQVVGRVGQLQHVVGVAALQVGPLVPDVERDVVAERLDVGAGAGLELDRGAAGHRRAGEVAGHRACR